VLRIGVIGVALARWSGLIDVRRVSIVRLPIGCSSSIVALLEILSRLAIGSGCVSIVSCNLVVSSNLLVWRGVLFVVVVVCSCTLLPRATKSASAHKLLLLLRGCSLLLQLLLLKLLLLLLRLRQLLLLLRWRRLILVLCSLLCLLRVSTLPIHSSVWHRLLLAVLWLTRRWICYALLLGAASLGLLPWLQHFLLYILLELLSSAVLLHSLLLESSWACGCTCSLSFLCHIIITLGFFILPRSCCFFALFFF
jgi:hypothetical protein